MTARSCCVCRNVSEREKLIRLVYNVDEGMIVIDAAQCMKGRGTYVHTESCCWNSKNLLSVVRRCLFYRRMPGKDRSSSASAIGIDMEREILRLTDTLRYWDDSKLTARKRMMSETLRKLLQVVALESGPCSSKVRVRL